MNPWWTEQTSILIGAIGGGGLGSLAGVVGAMSGTLAVKGRCRVLVVGLQAGLTLLGAGAVVVGVVGKFDGQPWHVTFPLLIGGGVLAVVCGCLLPMTLMLYSLIGAMKAESPEARVDQRALQEGLMGGRGSAAVRAMLISLWGPGGWLRQRVLIAARLLGLILVLAAVMGVKDALSGLPWSDWVALAGSGLLGGSILAVSAARMRHLVDHLGHEAEKQRLAAAEFRRT